MEIGDRVKWKPIDYRNMSRDTAHVWYNAVGTIIGKDILDSYWIALDDFPACNNRDIKNRFHARDIELEKIKEERS